MKRRELREHIFRLLFRVEFNSQDEMPEQIALYMEELPLATEEEQKYITDKYAAIVDRLPEIDAMLEKNSDGWKVYRMGKVDLTIMRLAVYEMKYDEDVPVSVAINEAVEIAKIFGGEESPSYINAVLGKIAKEDEQPKA